MLRQVTGKCLDRLGDAAVQGHPVGSAERPSTASRVSAWGNLVTDPIEQALRDRLVNERKAPGGGFVQRGRDGRDGEVTPDDGRGLHQPAAAGGDTIEPGADDVEHSARRSVRIPGALGHRRGDLADEQRIAAGDIENSPGVGLLYSHTRQLLMHLGEAEATQVETLDSG